MQIDFSSSGGVANVALNYRGDTATMPDAQARELEGLIESSLALGLKQEDVSSDAAIGRADVISYRLTLSDGDRQTTLWMNDVSAPATIRPLLAYLRKLAMEEKKAD